METKTFEEWMQGFEDRYDPETLEIMRDCWNHTVNTKKLTEKLGDNMDTKRWYIDWINDVAWKIGK